jgi:hypothetical protein
VKWLLAQRATRLSFRPRTPYFDYHKIQGDKDRLREQERMCCKFISECGEDLFGFKLDSSR